MAVLIADAPCHGVGCGGDKHVKENGVHQGDKIKRQVEQIFVQGGAELVFCRCGDYQTECMVEAFDKVLSAGRTFMDVFHVAGTSAAVFKEKIQGSLESCVAHAISPPSGLELDLFSGTDFSVALNLMVARFGDVMREVSAQAQGNENEAISAYQQLVGKLESQNYDCVRAAMSGVSEGAWGEYSWGTSLSKASMAALVRAGLTVEQLRQAGYPSEVTRGYEEYVHETLTQPHN
eukprot:TRINITY_DN55618_c0_g1_i1.p1 TRINITY_DN55618_c0_g1~~TRINITY_DN55618_c0_g1_i1.p1  ORF type:complete len:234 (+),score=48.20 TRINITY_DN55618_c0_g1_i1:194-895(+)